MLATGPGGRDPDRRDDRPGAARAGRGVAVREVQLGAAAGRGAAPARRAVAPLPAPTGYGLSTRSRSGVDPPARGDGREVVVERPAVGLARRPRGRASPPLSVIEPWLSPIARSSATSASLSTTSAGTRGQLGALGLDRLGAPGRPPGSASAPRSATAGVGEVPLAGELQQRQAVALGDRAASARAARGRARPSPRAGSRGGRAREARGRSRTSSWNRPP